MSEPPKLGYKIIGTIKNVKGTCSAGHKVGDKIELSGYDSGGLCGFFYHDIFPYIIMLQFGGNFPSDWGGDPEIVEIGCVDKINTVTIELRRLKEE
ncbi:MAG: TIGR04076 family protein [Promethearchaeota archaeon]